jgi:hypothetical protein
VKPNAKEAGVEMFTRWVECYTCMGYLKYIVQWSKQCWDAASCGTVKSAGGSKKIPASNLYSEDTEITYM